MRGRNLKKLMSILISTGMLVMLLTGVVSAGTEYNPVSGTSCNFNKYLIMDAGDSVPNATFSFTVAPGTARSTDTSNNDVMEVLAGIGTPTVSDVTFAPGDTTATSSTTDQIDIDRTNADRTGTSGTSDTVQLDSGEQFAVKQATVSFSGIQFDEPGIYRYIITETADAAHAAAGIVHDTDVDRVLDVYVIDKGTETNNKPDLEVAAYVLHTNDDDVVINTTSMGSNDPTPLADKTDGFTNEYSSKDLKVSKEVSGNQASRDKYFEITVTCTDVADADSYVVSIADDNDANTNDGNADATSGTTTATIAANQGQTNPTTVTGAQLKAGQKFYLQHGQSIVIRGLSPDASYTVTENAEDYKSAVMSGKTNSGKIGTVAGDNKMAEAGFTNTRNGVIPTGILLSATGLIVVALIVVFGIVFFAIRSKKRYEEE